MDNIEFKAFDIYNINIEEEKKRKRAKLLKLFIVLIVCILIWTLLLKFFLLYRYTKQVAYNEGLLMKVLQSELVPINMNYNTKEILKDVNENYNQYFSYNCENANVININHTWQSSFYTTNGEKIVIGIKEIEKNTQRNTEIYKSILTHECAHHILYKYGLTNNALHEALADVITKYLAENGQEMMFGKNNEGRRGSYTLITNNLIDKELCLNKVFEYKIEDIDNMLLRLQTFCNLSLVNNVFNKM